MTLESELKAELTDAMKSKDRERLNTIRMVKAEVLLAASAPGFSGTVDDELYRRVIAAQVKKDEKSIEEYGELGERGRPMVEKFTAEISYLSRWLPSKLGESETADLVAGAIADLGVAGDPKAAGQVIGHIMKSHKESIDGGLVNRLVRQALEA